MVQGKRFEDSLAANAINLEKKAVEVLQVNLGKFCNLRCVHCHVEAGPHKTAENMDFKTAQAVVAAMEVLKPLVLDLTGGAPELNPHFRYLVRAAAERGLRVIDRCNLSVFFEPGQDDLASFLRNCRVEITASLPCYHADNVDKQRGQGTFEASIRALKLLNELGYGNGCSDLILNLVYNPTGPFLPPAQAPLEIEYKAKLKQRYGVTFDRLLTITNMPITRYRKYLEAFGQLEDYEKLLREQFNPSTCDELMCLNTLSVGWDGRLYDCDFNQMLGLEINGNYHISNTGVFLDKGRRILTGEHCFGCTAGAGSSCQGALERV